VGEKKEQFQAFFLQKSYPFVASDGGSLEILFKNAWCHVSVCLSVTSFSSHTSEEAW